MWAYKSKRGEDNSFLFFIPRTIREELVEWYHDNLKHPGAERLIATISQHFN